MSSCAALLLGVLLLRHLWLLLRRRLAPWPALVAPPLGPLDMVLLVAGGFVVLGEVLAPLVVLPVAGLLTRSLPHPLPGHHRSVRLYRPGGSAAADLAPAAQNARCIATSSGGWLQWRLQPVGTPVLQAYGVG